METQRPLTDEDKVARVVRALTLRYLESCEANRISRGTAAQLLGISRTRLVQMERSASAGERMMVSVVLFLRLKQLLEGVTDAREAEVLPAASKRGAAQTAVLEFFGRAESEEKAEEKAEQD